jgi:hypothetical protein
VPHNPGFQRKKLNRSQTSSTIYTTDLRKHSPLFVQLEAEYGGRDGAIHALEFVLKFFDALKRKGIYPLIVQDGVQAPLDRLFDDLMSLDNGMVSPMLSPRKKLGRARASSLYDGMKAVAVFTVRHLMATGLSLPEARKLVAAELAKQGIRPARKGSRDGSGQFSERTLRTWEEGIAADIGCHGTPAGTLAKLEAAHLADVLAWCGLKTLPEGATPDSLLAERCPTDRLRPAYLEKLADVVRKTRAQETT